MTANFPDDPLGLLPASLPPHPRVLLNADDLARCRRFAVELPWAKAAYAVMLEAARAYQLPPIGDDPPALGHGQALLNLAIAAALEENETWAKTIVAYLHKLSQHYGSWPLHEDCSRILDQQHGEQMLMTSLAQAYDLCVELAGTDETTREEIKHRLFHPAMEEVVWNTGHRTCDNHRTTGIEAAMAVGGATGEMSYIHEAFYGHAYGEGGLHTAGFVHQLMHDFLGDGLHWERTPDYYLYMLYLLNQIAWMAQRLGVDVWNKKWPAATAPSGLEENHADYDAAGEKTLFDYFLALLYFAGSDGSIAGIGDSVPRRIHELKMWGPLYEPIWARSGDERFAWLLTRQYEALQKERSLEYSPRGQGYQEVIGTHSFIFVEKAELPAGAFDFEQDTKNCLTGRHENGCTLFPSSGYAILRADAKDAAANNVTFVFGPHHAGHQHADLLSFVWQVNGQTALLDTANFGYDDMEHGEWDCQTVAHNTVLMDGVSQRPQGDSDYFWMTHPGSNVPRGELLDFQSDGPVKAVAAQTTNAYEAPATLRRALLVTEEYVLDRFECWSENEHRWDYALNPCAPIQSTLDLLPQAQPLGAAHGFKQIKNLRAAALPASGTQIGWADYAAWLWCSSAAQLNIGEAPAHAGWPGVVATLTQNGARVEYRGVFSRRADGLKIEGDGAVLRIGGEGFRDEIKFEDNAIIWTRERGGKTETKTISWMK